jgi:pyrimidine-nucleoside phosphorylase
VQRTGAGREKAGEAVDPHAGILFHAKCGVHIEKGKPLATLYATNQQSLPEPVELIKQAMHFSATPAPAVALISRTITHAEAEQHLLSAPCSSNA